MHIRPKVSQSDFVRRISTLHVRVSVLSERFSTFYYIDCIGGFTYCWHFVNRFNCSKLLNSCQWLGINVCAPANSSNVSPLFSHHFGFMVHVCVYHWSFLHESSKVATVSIITFWWPLSLFCSNSYTCTFGPISQTSLEPVLRFPVRLSMQVTAVL